MKRTLPLALKFNGECARAEGIKPGKKWSDAQRSKVKSCVLKKMRLSGK